MLAKIGVGRWGPDLGIRMILEKIWQLLQEPDMEEIHPDCKLVADMYMNERAVFDKTARLWTVEMMRRNDQYL